jgi:hypothetical protein
MDAEAAGFDLGRLGKFARFVRGHGCVVSGGRMVYQWGDAARPCDVASVVKPVIVHLLLAAVDSGRLAGLDEPVFRHENGLAALNREDGYPERDMTWRHLATQTACYGVTEKPGEAFCYSDYQAALLCDTLFGGVYGAEAADIDERDLLAVWVDGLPHRWARFKEGFNFTSRGHQDLNTAIRLLTECGAS